MYKYEVNLPSTDEHVKNRTISFTGTPEEIDALKKGPVEITCTENINGWIVQYRGSNTGILDIKAQKFIGNKTYVFQAIIPNAVKRFVPIDLNEYDPYDPSGYQTSGNFVELDDHKDVTSKFFTKEYHERRYSKSSILSVYEFLKNEEFENMLKSIKLEDV